MREGGAIQSNGAVRLGSPIFRKARDVSTAWLENADRLSAVRSPYLSAAYHKHVFPEATPELGCASVRKVHRNKHVSSRIFEKLLSGPIGSSYAVTSDDKMKHLLGKHGFVTMP